MVTRALFPALAVLVPLAMLAAFALYVRRRRHVGAVLGDRRLVGRLTGDDLHRVPWRRVLPVFAAALVLGAALADPGATGAAVPTGGRDVVLVLDVSASMQVEDVQPSRLEVQRRTAHRLLDALPDDRVGLVAFAGQASVLAPPTPDHGAVRMLLDAISPAVAVQTGSAVGAGIRQAGALLVGRSERAGARLVVLLSDGETIGEDDTAEAAAALAAARVVAGLGVPVHSLAIGTAAGGPVPAFDAEAGRRTGFVTDPSTGARAISRLDGELMRGIAEASGGRYLHLTRDDDAAPFAVRLQADGDPSRPAGSVPLALWLAGAALLLLAADAVAERTHRRR